MPQPTKQQQLAALAQAEAALHLAGVKCQRDPHNSTFRLEQAQWQATVQSLRTQLFGRGGR
ncbi:hypothetical protein H6F86_10445 [Phormidium sp. FACHB-592]|uniref:Uncharacterized protein n=1 Tax=Stenomitos frigidus AS-A4 TaxID=2933935 RepID=A0ABV0KUH6_9CYAN|nr:MULTISPECIES: hypothetical protein [Cyanophyceae]MBD2033824.1 hypothetical protein [Leptolyngbya sp. FACHB-321]MBD2074299.1 hypothetical protein [Phormidium sp. FACHB-592]